MKILVIEDEPEMRDNIICSLERESYLVETASDFDAAIEKVHLYDYDCILLDIALPGGSGITILKELKKLHKTEGVIIISAKNSLDDKIEGLSLGADDYLAKPFHLAELNARIKSLLRRRNFQGNNLVKINNLMIDPDNRIAYIDENKMVLNRKEFDILIYFVSNKNRLVTRTALAEHIWGDHIDEANSFEFIYSQIKNLRKKLKDHEAHIEIQAIYGVGYTLITDEIT